MSFQNQNDINELLFRLLDNEISDRGLSRLEEWLNNDPSAKQYYCQFMEDCSALSLRSTTVIEDDKPSLFQDQVLDEAFWGQLLEEEKNAPGLEIVKPCQKAEPHRIQRIERVETVRTINKTSLVTAIAAIAALLVMIVYVNLVPPASYEMATVSDSMNAQWSSKLSLSPGTRISSYTEPIQLTQGIVKLLTDDYVEVVLEAPTEFEFISYSEIALNYGKLFAHVSEQGSGFSVTTPNAKIVDLGTEFGVLSHIDGSTEIHMYEGKANLFTGNKSAKKISQLLLAGAARKVEHANSVAKTIALKERILVRDIDSKDKWVWRGQPLDLADIVGGGNGFGTGRLNQGIEATTGAVAHTLSSTDVQPGSEGYVGVPSNPYLDGIFVPGIGSQMTQLSLNGLQTEEFPKTSGLMWGYIFNGAYHVGWEVPRHNLQLNGVTFDGNKETALTMHSNLGITFDLHAIRKKVPGVKIKSFSSTLGISETVGNWLKSRDFSDWDQTPDIIKLSTERQSTAEFWVFLDGKKVLRQLFSSSSSAESIDIPIDESVRYLTLAVTESDDTNAYDWALFAWPKLVLK